MVRKVGSGESLAFNILVLAQFEGLEVWNIGPKSTSELFDMCWIRLLTCLSLYGSLSNWKRGTGREAGD